MTWKGHVVAFWVPQIFCIFISAMFIWVYAHRMHETVHLKFVQFRRYTSVMIAEAHMGMHTHTNIHILFSAHVSGADKLDYLANKTELPTKASTNKKEGSPTFGRKTSSVLLTSDTLPS